MDTNRLKRFAAEARNKIREGVMHKLLSLGFNAEGEADEFPRQLQGSTLFRGVQLEASFYPKWIALHEAIHKHGMKAVYEEVAYTWFNRFMAIRILQMNGFADRVLVFDNPEIRVPHIVTEARLGRFPQMTAEERLQLRDIIADPTKTYEQFALLITAFCHETPILNRCFGRINDYTELLLPNNILDEGGFVDMINHTDFIAEEDYKTTELLGWLYQFYIAERKDEVFASFKKGKKAEADDIAPATQIFTPNWIVKYMVQNTVGRIYMDNNPGTDLGEKMPYLVERTHGNNAETFTYTQLEDLRVIDPACGSGHILLEAFDLLYEMYLDEFYSREEAITAIFEHNLVGIDLDSRARQLATFALLLKACQRTDYFLEAPALPQVLDMEQLIPSFYGSMRERLAELLCIEKAEVLDELLAAYELMEQAGSLGSIMRFDIGSETRELIAHTVAEHGDSANEDMQELLPGFKLILALTRKYAAVVANPPYMGAGNMNTVLSSYVKKNYKEGKTDLATVFVQLFKKITGPNGSYAFIIPPSWLFLSTFEDLRKDIIHTQSIQSLLHLSRGVFGADFGAVSCVIQNTQNTEAKGTYFRLIERTFQEFDQSHLRMLFEQTLANHDFKYRFKDYTKETTELPYSEDGNRIYYPNVEQKNFEKIPGMPVGYWVSENVSSVFKEDTISSYCEPKSGLSSSDNNRFLRHWFEPSLKRINFRAKEEEDTKNYKYKWYPIQRGGGFRKWYGLNIDVLNWENNGEEIKGYASLLYKSYTRTIKNIPYYFKSGVSWSYITSGEPSFRKFETGHIIINAGPACFNFKDGYQNYIHAYLNTCVASKLLKLTQPTFNFDSGPISKLPMIVEKDILPRISAFVDQNISISKSDWDAHETSWDFERNELLSIDESTYESNKAYLEACGDDRICKEDLEEVEQKYKFRTNMPLYGSLAWRMQQYKLKWEQKFMQLHANEEELNRQFIDIYGLQEELTPDVPFNEITILQQGEISIEED